MIIQHRAQRRNAEKKDERAHDTMVNNNNGERASQRNNSASGGASGMAAHGVATKKFRWTGKGRFTRSQSAKKMRVLAALPAVCVFWFLAILHEIPTKARGFKENVH